MKKKLLVLGLGLCFLAAACGGKKTSEETLPDQNMEESGQDGDAQDMEQPGDETDAPGDEDGRERDKNQSGNETDDPDDGDGREQDEKDTADENGTPAQTPEVTFVDYSRDIRDDGEDIMLLSVTENCPVITIAGKEDIAQRMNMVFEQQHTTNQEEIQKKADAAKESYQGLPKEEREIWSGYGYGMSYKVAHVSVRLLSIEAEGYDWEGGAHPNTWTSAYCFDVQSGDLLSLADVLTDEKRVREVVSQHILDTITKDPYKDALLDDYESYVNDVMTENTFYLNDKGLVVICNPYMVTAYAAGTIKVEVPYGELSGIINERFL